MTVRIAFVGDSFIEGIGDERPDGTPRGWADRLVEKLAARLDEPVYYANFAIRGRILRPIVMDQLDAALALVPQPDLIVFNGGGNDMLRPTFSVDKVMRLTRIAVAKCDAAGVPLVLVTGANPTDELPLSRLMAKRGSAYMAAVEELVAVTGNQLISNWDDAETHDPRYWAEDRLHLGPLGHERVATVVLTELGYPTEPPHRGDPAAPLTFRSELRYARRHILPYVGRRVASRSSGRKVLPKHPTWHLVAG